MKKLSYSCLLLLLVSFFCLKSAPAKAGYVADIRSHQSLITTQSNIIPGSDLEDDDDDAKHKLCSHTFIILPFTLLQTNYFFCLENKQQGIFVNRIISGVSKQVFLQVFRL